MNNVKQQELGNELQSSQHLRLQCVSCLLPDTATVALPPAQVQLKKSIAGIRSRVGRAPSPAAVGFELARKQFNRRFVALLTSGTLVPTYKKAARGRPFHLNAEITT
jgi:hypothetical protein